MSNLTVGSVTKDLALYKKQFQSVLPAHIPVDKFLRTTVGAIQNNPNILQCDKQSILASCQKAAQDGLILDGREAALVKFKNQAQYMPMVNGVLKKLRNSGQLSTITAQTVHKNDFFEYNPAVDSVPNHKPDWFGDRGEMIGVYAVAKMKDGGSVVEIMNKTQIEKVKNVSRSKDFGPWKDWEEEMSKKTVLRRIAKLLPSSSDLDQVFEHDNENYDLNQREETEINQGKKKTRAAAIVTQSSEEAEPEAIEGELVSEQQEEDII